MPAECTVCAHPDREELDAGLRAGLAKTELARRHELSRDAIGRHERNGHVATTLSLVASTAEPGSLGLDALVQRVEAVLTAAEQDGRASSAVAAARELRLLYGELAKQNPQGVSTVDYATDPAWLRTRQAIVDALDPFPDARSAVVAALAEVDQ